MLPKVPSGSASFRSRAARHVPDQNRLARRKHARHTRDTRDHRRDHDATRPHDTTQTTARHAHTRHTSNRSSRIRELSLRSPRGVVPAAASAAAIMVCELAVSRVPLVRGARLHMFNLMILCGTHRARPGKGAHTSQQSTTHVCPFAALRQGQRHHEGREKRRCACMAGGLTCSS